MAASDDRPSPALPGKLSRRVARDSIALAMGSIAAGMLAYAFFAVASRSLGADAAAPISVLWTYWSIAAAVLTFTVQHWTIRTLAHDGHEGTVSRSVPRIALMGVALAVATGIVAYGLRNHLFHDDGFAYPAMVAAITLGSLFIGLLRGALAGRQRYVATAVSIVGENALRVILASIVALIGMDSRAFGVALVAGPVVGLIWAGGLRFDRQHEHAAIRSPLTIASGIAGGSLIAQIVLTSAPVVLAVSGGSPGEVTSLFLALAIWRAPYLVALGVTPQLTALLSRLVVRRQSDRLAKVRLLAVSGVVAGSGLAAVLGLTVMRPLMELAFGEDVGMDPWALACLGVGTSIALGNLTFLLMLFALGRPGVASGAWLGAIGVALGWLAFSGQPPLTAVVVAFLLAQTVAFVPLFGFSRLPRHITHRAQGGA